MAAAIDRQGQRRSRGGTAGLRWDTHALMDLLERDCHAGSGDLSAGAQPSTPMSRETLRHLQSIGVEMGDVGQAPEHEGMAIFTKSFEDLLTVLNAKRATQPA